MQRFLIAILQKCSIQKELIPIYVELNMIDWITKMILRSHKTEIHPFILNFGSAILPCIVHAPTTAEYFEDHPQKVYKVSLLNYLHNLERW